MHKCLYRGYRGPEVAESICLGCYCCDDCYEDKMKALAQSNVDASYSNGEQDF